jgi:hypothetical protein
MDMYPDISVEEASTSYFGAAQESLDPRLFDEYALHPNIRHEILTMLFTFLASLYKNPRDWTHAWIAGSGVSYQWESARYPADLDCLVGIDYPTFRSDNPHYRGLSDEEISKQINEDFNLGLSIHTKEWRGFELTFYVNPDSWDITTINPYAAYDLVEDRWAVEPSYQGVPYTREWAHRASRDHATATEVTRRYTQALAELKAAQNPAHRVNAERALQMAVEQGVSLYDELHGGRKVAFSRLGAGYSDFNNYRWQAGKSSGVVQAMKRLKDYREAVRAQGDINTYGLELPDTNTLIRRAATYRSPR